MIVEGYRQKGQPIQLEELKSFLWGAATRLRGQIDAAGYKEYIFPLLFFKRISDVYDEQYAGFLHDGGEEYANMQSQELAIRIPDGAHWKDVRQVTENVGQRLVEAFIAIEQANPGEETDGRVVGGLDGIFGPKDGWTNKAKMPDHIITGLIEDFSKYDLSLASCPADEMGQAYEYLVGKFADDAGNTAQEFYTNRTVVTLMAEILQPKPNESIYDPTCGSGGMLVKCLDYLRLKGQPWQGVKVFGQEINALTSAIARMNLYLNGVEDFSIVREDTLAHPAFVDGSHLRKFDIVLANPPYSIKTWDRESFMNDKWGRNIWGTPIQARADYAFIQHIFCSMKEKNGRCAILLPHGVLNRDEDKELRLNHIKTDTIEAIIGLGRNLFYNSGLESFIFIFNNNKKPQFKGKVLFIEAEKCTHKEGKQSYLYDDDISRILSAYHSSKDIPGFSKYVSIDELLDNDASLNIKAYVKPIENSDTISLGASYSLFKEASKKLHNAYTLLGFDENSIIDSSSQIFDVDHLGWEKVRLGDVAFEYTERIDNPSESNYEFYIGSDCIGQYDFRIRRKDSAKSVTSSQKIFHQGDYLLVRRSLYGSDFRERAPRADFEGICSADILTIRENPNYIYDGFLIYVLYSKDLWNYVVANSSGGLTRRIKWKQLQEFEFLLPPMSVQRSISRRLWAAYNLKERYKTLYDQTDEYVKSQFIEMLKGKAINGTISDLVTPKIENVKQTYSPDDTIQYIDISSINAEDHYVSQVTEYSVKNAPLRAQQCVKYGDLLVSTVRPINRNIAIVDKDLDNLVASTGFCVLRPNDGMLNYLLSIVLSDDYTDAMCDKANGGVYPAVNNGDVLNYQIHIPDDDLAKRASLVRKQADKSKFELRKSIEAIDKVIKSLINS